MARSDFNPGSSGAGGEGLPLSIASIPEEQLLAWIEGELSAAEVSALASKHPEAVAMVASLRRDRATLASVAMAHAPADLSDRVMAALERETLLGLSRGELVSDSLPVSRVPKKKTASQIWWQQATPRLALAAGVVLIVSVGVVLTMQGGTQKSPIDPVALNDTSNTKTPSGIDQPGERSRGMASREENTKSADADITSKDSAPPEPATMAAAAMPSKAINAERAAVLASEGRLVLRARDVSRGAAAKLKTARARTSSVWQVQGALEPTTLAMLTPMDAPIQPGIEPPQESMLAVAASGLVPREDGAVSINPLLLVHPAPDLGPLEPLHRGDVVDVLAGGVSIESAREQLSKLLGREVEFEESAIAIVIEAPASTPESVLWWTQPPESWGTRVRLPLIVELK